MFKKIFLVALVLHFSSAYACKVYIPEKEYNHHGWVVNFDFTELLTKKNYTEVYSPAEAQYQIVIEGVEEEGRIFHHAKGVIRLYQSDELLVAATGSVRCLTQLCSLGDFAKSFNKSYKNFSKLLKKCSE